MMRKREPHWQSASERARVAAELIEEAELLTTTGGMATPAELKRDQLPPPLVPEFTLNRASGAGGSPAPDPEPAAAAAPTSAPAPAPADARLAGARDSTVGANGRYASARADLERELRDDPANVDAHLALAQLLSRKGLRTESLPHLKQAVELDPNHVAAWHQLGEALNQSDDLAGARAAYERAIALDPRHARSLYGLGIVLDRLHRPDEATLMYRRSREAAGR
jgi:tetratricopeptide (TPR) repeat protein